MLQMLLFVGSLFTASSPKQHTGDRRVTVTCETLFSPLRTVGSLFLVLINYIGQSTALFFH